MTATANKTGCTEPRDNVALADPNSLARGGEPARSAELSRLEFYVL